METEFTGKVADSEFEGKKKERREGGDTKRSGMVLFPCPFPSLNQEMLLT